MFFLKQYRKYWSLRHAIKGLAFFLQKSYFRSIRIARSSIQDVSVIGFLFRKTTGITVLSIIVLCILIICDIYLLNTKVSRWSIIQDILNHYHTIQSIITEQNDAVRELLVVLGSIAGLLLGLYFTAISVVVSSRFVSISPGMREHFLKEPGGRQYLKLLAVTTIWSLILLVYNISGQSIGFMSLFSVVLFGLFGISAFLYLSVRAFYFLDPTVLGDTILAELITTTRLATIKGRFWNNESFQNHYKQRAITELSSLESMLELASRESHLTRDSLRLLIAKCGVFLREHLKLRMQIPSQSHWYKRIPQHDNYFLASDSQLTIALEAGGSIQPKEVPEQLWLDKDIVSAIANSLRLLPDNRRLGLTYNTLISFQEYIESIGYQLEVSKGINLIEKIVDPGREQMETEPKRTDKERELHLASFDASRLSYLALVLGCLKRISEIDIASLIDEISHINWLSGDDIYKQSYAPVVLTTVESIKKELEFEYEAEGNIVSPPWYIGQLVIKSILDNALISLKHCLAILDDIFVAAAALLVQNKKYTLCTFHCQRGLELCSKLDAHLRTAEQVWNEAEEYRIEKEIPWPKPDWKAMNKQINNGRKQIIDNFAKCLPSLAQVTHDKSFPDLFGQGYNIVCWECHQALYENESDRFDGLFPILAISAMSANQQLRVELTGWLPESQIAIAGDPILDLVAISGYALVYSELYSNHHLWNKCQEVWSTLLSTSEDKRKSIEYFVNLYEYRHGNLQISPRQTIRTRWQMMLNSKLREMDLVSERYQYPFLQNADDSTKHGSAIIRFLVRGGYEPLISVSELFIVEYLLKQPEADSIAFNDRHDIRRRLDKENNSNGEQ